MERTDFKNIIIEKIPSTVVFEGFFEVAEVSFRNFIKTKTILNSLQARGARAFFFLYSNLKGRKILMLGSKRLKRWSPKFPCPFFHLINIMTEEIMSLMSDTTDVS